MKSFCELLGASADDDEEALKKAFRTAVKAHHPDLHPGDPDAAARFRDILDANARLRVAKQRAAYDQQLKRERQQFQLTLQRHQRTKLQLQRQQRKRMRTIGAVAAVGALIGGYGVFAPVPTTTTVEINKDEHAATTGAAVRQTMTIIPAAQMSAGEPVEMAGAQSDGPSKPNADA